MSVFDEVVKERLRVLQQLSQRKAEMIELAIELTSGDLHKNNELAYQLLQEVDQLTFQENNLRKKSMYGVMKHLETKINKEKTLTPME